jgi:hypothetical protein
MISSLRPPARKTRHLFRRKPAHSAGEAHTFDRLDPVLFRRFADDENRRFVVAGQAVRPRQGYDGVSATAFTSGYAGSIQPGFMLACA